MTYRGDLFIYALVFAASGVIWDTFYLAAIGFLVAGVLGAWKERGHANSL